MIELKLCPFCDGEAFHYSSKDNINLDTMSNCDKELHFIMCKDCTALVCGQTEEIAAARWNKRVKL